MKVIDFPRNKPILDDGKFHPAPYSVIGKMTYLENAGGYWWEFTEDDDLMFNRLESLGITDEFNEKGRQFLDDNTKTFEILSPATGEIFAIFEAMEYASGYHMGFFAFRDEFSFMAKRMDLLAFRLPNARADYESGALFDLDVTEAGTCND